MADFLWHYIHSGSSENISEEDLQNFFGKIENQDPVFEELDNSAED